MKKWLIRIGALAAVTLCAAQQVPAPPVFKLTHELTGYYRDGDFIYNVKGDVLRFSQATCTDNRNFIPGITQNWVGCPPGATCGSTGGGGTVYQMPCSDPEITIGNLEQLQRTIHDLQLVQKAWEDKRRIEAYVNSKFE